jgi:hemoglobin
MTRRLASFNVHEAVGGTPAWRKLSVAFYARVQQDPLLRPLFPGKTLHCAIEEFTAFLAQLFGGPSEDSQRRWWLSLQESHRRFAIGPKERAAWMRTMVKTLDDIQLEEPIRGALREFFEQASAHVVNRGKKPAARVSKPGGELGVEIARRWQWQRELDEAVDAVRAGDIERAIAGAEVFSKRNRSVYCGLLALMLRSRNPALLAHLESKIAEDAALVSVRYAGRTLLHEAASVGDLNIVQKLLQVGADPNVLDGGSHAPLYSVANQCGAPTGAAVVQALAGAGADVNANGGVKRCTALHMAARRGNAGIAEALIECGANIEAPDSAGVTPLRRAVNCKKPQVAALLLEEGARKDSAGRS